jgi:hypothetical protein
MEELVRDLKKENSDTEVSHKNNDFFNMYKKWCVTGSFKDDLNKHQFGMKVKKMCKTHFNTGKLACITKCPSNSKTTLNIADLVEYFKSINVFFE